jgi:hypothetical protein
MPQANSHSSTRVSDRKLSKKSICTRGQHGSHKKSKAQPSARPQRYPLFKAFPGMTPQEMVASASLAKFDVIVKAAFAELCRRDDEFTYSDFSKEINDVGRMKDDFRDAANVFREVAKMIDDAMKQKRRAFLRFGVML